MIDEKGVVRVTLTTALCIICHDRPDELTEALRSGGDLVEEHVVVDMGSSPPLDPIPGVRWVRFEENEGVTAGRNACIDVATSDILVFLDDDAVMTTPYVDRLKTLFAKDAKLAVVAFKVQRAGGQIEKLEFPFRGAVKNPSESRPCAYFLGGAFAGRRTALLAAGGFDPDFFYSTEEVELAYRLMVRGRTLWYESSIVVEHRPSMLGRSIKPHVPALRLRNRLAFAWRHLPFPVMVLHVGLWAIRTALEAHQAGALGPWAGSWHPRVWKKGSRRPLAGPLLWRMHRLGGRVFW